MSDPLKLRVPFFLIFSFNEGTIQQKGQKGTTQEPLLQLGAPSRAPLRVPLKVPLRAPLRVPLRAPLRVPFTGSFAPLMVPLGVGALGFWALGFQALRLRVAV